MPEYLAPAVYVEETSFRPKPIEGVSTSTTAFVGPTARGPTSGPVELITSAGDFERIFGSTRRLNLGLPRPLEGYMAHAVRAYFANGGSRLYVARAFEPRSASDGVARSADLVTSAGGRARFAARFPGAAGNGRIEVIQQLAPAAWASMRRAPDGTMVRSGGQSPSTPASVEGGVPPFRVADQAQLALNVNGTDHVVTFEGQAARVTAPTALPVDVTLDASNNTLSVEVNGIRQDLTLSVGTRPRAEVALEMNRLLEGGFADLDADRLVIGSEILGLASTVSVTPNAALGFTFAETDPARSATGTGNVPNLRRVTANDLTDLLGAEGVPLTLSVGPTLAIRLTTEGTGTSQAITVSAAAAPAASAHTALQLPLGTQTGSDGSTLAFYVKSGAQWRGTTVGDDLVDGTIPTGGLEFVSVNVVAEDADGLAKNYDELAFSPEHPRYIGDALAPNPARRLDQLENVFALEITGTVTPFELRSGLLGTSAERAHLLQGGDDGLEPSPERYREALERLEVLEDISILAAPGFSAYTGYPGTRDHLRNHVERRRAYQIAVLDTPPQLTVGEARDFRSTIDSRYVAIYYPWIIIPNPDARPGDRTIPPEIVVPPSGHVCGIYARNDVERGVYKAPANEVVRGAIRFESQVNMAQQAVLNPEGVNALRSFPGRGLRVWGARVATSDSEWKYVNVRRYFNYVEASIDRGTQWVVFEPNGERLWARVRASVTDFLYNEWRNGALLGSTPKDAFFVRCDRSTMTENDLENGRLICEIGISVLKPAEFVIFRIGQWTASARS